jgi:hypothetical protein
MIILLTRFQLKQITQIIFMLSENGGNPVKAFDHKIVGLNPGEKTVFFEKSFSQSSK